MARRGRVCVAPECSRRAEPGSVVCADHRWTALGAETDREIVQLTRRFEAMSKVEGAEKRRASAEAFTKQVQQGEYAALQSAKMLQMLDDSGGEANLTREIGMLRMAMLRVLTEEEQPSRMAHALAKLSFAVGRTMKLQEGELKERRELSEGERWRIAMDQLFPPFPAEDESAESVAMHVKRERVMQEVWRLMEGAAAEEDEGAFRPASWPVGFADAERGSSSGE